MLNSLMISTIFDSLFLNGRLIRMKRAIRTDVNINIGRAYIGLDENTPITRAYTSFLKYLIIIRKTPKRLVLSIPL